MKTRVPFVTFRHVSALTIASLICAIDSRADAGVLVGGWNYAIDSQTDGSGSAEGFEYRGMAFQQVGNTDYFTFSSQMPLTGIDWGGTLNNNIGNGDLILNFSSHNLVTAADFTDPGVFAVRFDATNDSLGNIAGSNPTIGLFGSIAPFSPMLLNSGYGSLQQYYDYGFNPNDHNMADLSTASDVINYFGNGAMFPSISAGTLLGGISLLDRGALGQLGLDFGQFGADPNGNSVFGFSLDASLLPAGSFIASLFMECTNDGMAMFGTNLPDFHIESSVPEPGSLVLAIAGLAGMCGWKLQRRMSNV